MSFDIHFLLVQVSGGLELVPVGEEDWYEREILSVNSSMA